MAVPAVINWSLSSYFGWGVYGLNLALQLDRGRRIEAVSSYPIVERQLVLDPLRRAALSPFAARSAAFQAGLAGAGERTQLDAPVLHFLDDDFQARPTAAGTLLQGRPNIGVTFFQNAIPDPAAVGRARAFPVMVAGSSWNAELLRAYGLADVRLIIQGVDPTLFHPAPRAGGFRDRFLVFSGGKIERRKAQDIVIGAFAAFARRHPEALLVTAWHSPWPEFTATVDEDGKAAPVALRPDGRVDVGAWAERNGIRRDQVLDLGMVPNPLLPQVLREVDLAVFPNRAEGGTNLVAMECMACGVPTVLSANTGHLDLIEEANGYALRDQRPIGGAVAGYGGVSGWCESDPAELLEAMERAYADRADAAERGRRGAETLARFSWAATADRMADLIVEQAGRA
jgi:glycosyltransferase involved in cell wall biosynthesis